jgi:methylated-DNA-[protein]-cysteine S-methyltransferase
MTQRELWTSHESSIGPLTLVGGDGWLSHLWFPGRAPVLAEADYDPDVFEQASHQLDEYVLGPRREFDLELALDGTPFQLAVWEEIARVPYGETVSYTELAGRIGRPDRVPAVAGAIARTPVPIVIPCHRVVGADGSLRGYAGGLPRKQALLSMERAVAAGRTPEPAWAVRQLAMQV